MSKNLKVMSKNLKRKKRVLHSCANPLFVKWVEELRDNAKEKGHQSHFTYSKALSSLKKYPLPLHSGEDAVALDYVEVDQLSPVKTAPSRTTTCDSPSVKLTSSPVIKIGGSSPMSKFGAQKRSFSKCFTTSATSHMEEKGLQQAEPESMKQKEYIPVYKSGAYALIMALYEAKQKPSWKGYCTKVNLMEDAQPFSVESFKPAPGGYYSAWSSMSTLIRKGLVIKRSSPAKYSLTERGENLAMKLISSSNHFPSQSSQETTTDLVPTRKSNAVLAEGSSSSIQSTSTSASQSSEVESSLDMAEFQLMPGSYEIVLLVDSSESTASRVSTSQFNGVLLQELGKNGVIFDVRKLNIGDFAWTIREKTIPKPGSLSVGGACEAVLDYIVERKRFDDLAGSILDGRFKEQKFRLKNCGLLHLIYLIEEHGGVNHSLLDNSVLDQAITNTQIHEGYYVKWTKDISGTVAYLTFLTRALQLKYQDRIVQAYSRNVMELIKERRGHTFSGPEVKLLTFSSFNEESLKNKVQSVQEVFLRQLMMVPGISSEKAAVLVKKYPTLYQLYQAYCDCYDEDHKERLLKNLQPSTSTRQFGSRLSELLCSIYGK